MDYSEKDFPFQPGDSGDWGDGLVNEDSENDLTLDLLQVDLAPPVNEVNDESECKHNEPTEITEAEAAAMDIDDEDPTPEGGNQLPNNGQIVINEPDTPEEVYVDHFGGHTGEVINNTNKTWAGYHNYSAQLVMCRNGG